ncbi:DHH family phosphoesterase [Geomonas sp. Red32]|uniref:DHH family phosphoesterase n=1 Tax=Geomonas sp. Red32 TaxID=2912856 RepID=UPI00202CF02D|nr:DHH family phosphoesterase [Geomonas sp. Red32]MCM0082043.1 DHH family phosphoesterase [Geomonas sp. Red32]
MTATKTEMAAIAAEITNNSSFLITSHESPDPDAVGSTLALANYLTSRGKDVTIYLQDPVPASCMFLPMAKDVVSELPDRDFEVCFVLDIGEFRRAGKAITTSTRINRFINVDHHLGCENFGVHNVIDPTACATAALIYRIIKECGDEVDYPTGLCIYTAILSDTGSFHYSNSTPEAFAIAGEMIGKGVNAWNVNENLYESEPLQRIALLALALSDLTISQSGEYASVTVTLDMYEKTGATAEDTDRFINYPRSIRGVEVALFFRQIDENSFKIGFRSKGKINVAAVSASFGGGGHHNAAGCTINGTLAEVKKLVFERLEQMR